MRRTKGFRLGRISQVLFPGFSHCRKCQTTWNLVEGHTVWYSERFDERGIKIGGSGTFALCEKCWDESSTEERVKYYGEVNDDQHADFARSHYEAPDPRGHKQTLLDAVRKASEP